MFSCLYELLLFSSWIFCCHFEYLGQKRRVNWEWISPANATLHGARTQHYNCFGFIVVSVDRRKNNASASPLLSNNTYNEMSCLTLAFVVAIPSAALWRSAGQRSGKSPKLARIFTWIFICINSSKDDDDSNSQKKNWLINKKRYKNCSGIS